MLQFLLVAGVQVTDSYFPDVHCEHAEQIRFVVDVQGVDSKKPGPHAGSHTEHCRFDVAVQDTFSYDPMGQTKQLVHSRLLDPKQNFVSKVPISHLLHSEQFRLVEIVHGVDSYVAGPQVGEHALQTRFVELVQDDVSYETPSVHAAEQSEQFRFFTLVQGWFSY